MPATLAEVKELIEHELPGADVSDVKEKNHRIIGTIVWPKFKHMSARERNQLVTDRVRNKLGYKILNVGFLLPLSSGDEL